MSYSFACSFFGRLKYAASFPAYILNSNIINFFFFPNSLVDGNKVWFMMVSCKIINDTRVVKWQICIVECTNSLVWYEAVRFDLFVLCEASHFNAILTPWFIEGTLINRNPVMQ